MANTFLEHVIRTNSLITIANELTEGNLLTTGTISISNAGGYQNNVSLNVRSGMIYGDAGLLSNVGKPSSITNQKLQNSTFSLVVGRQLSLTNPTIALGSTVYLNVANLVTVNTDISTANIASANLVNAVHGIARRAEVNSSKAYDSANAANIAAISAFNLANSANFTAASTGASVSGFALALSKTSANTESAFNKANSANVLAFNTGPGANAFASATIAGANTRVGLGANAFAAATIAGANTRVGDGANAFSTDAIATSETFLLATIDGANTLSGDAAITAEAAFNQANVYVMMHYVSGNPANASHVYFHAAPFAVDIPAGLTDSQVIANNRPTAVMAMTITKNGTNVGTINFTGGASGVAESAGFTVGSTISLAAGDILGIRNGPTVSPQFQNIMFSIVGTKV